MLWAGVLVLRVQVVKLGCSVQRFSELSSRQVGLLRPEVLQVVKSLSRAALSKSSPSCQVCSVWLKVCQSVKAVLLMFLSYDSPQRFAAWRSGGFLAQKFNRRTTLEPTTKLSYEALHPPLRQTAVTCWCSVVFLCTLLSVLSFSVIVCRVVRLHIFFQKGRRFFFNSILSAWER
jgi:hypothetical protein